MYFTSWTAPTRPWAPPPAADYDAGRTSLDLLLRTQVSVAEADRAYLESVVAYNKTLVDLCYRQGVLLQENAVLMAEAI